MSDEKHTPESNDSSIYYVLGGVVFVAAVAGFFLLKPKEKVATPATTTPCNCTGCPRTDYKI